MRPHAVGLMAIENLFRYPALAVGLKPSARQGEARLRGLWRNNYSKTISPRLSRAKPACASRELQRRPYRPSAIAYRLSPIAYRLSPIECKARRCRPDRIPTPAHEAPVPPNQDDAGASSHSGTRPCWQRRVRTGGRLLPSFLRRHSNPAASGARQR